MIASRHFTAPMAPTLVRLGNIAYVMSTDHMDLVFMVGVQA